MVPLAEASSVPLIDLVTAGGEMLELAGIEDTVALCGVVGVPVTESSHTSKLPRTGCAGDVGLETFALSATPVVPAGLPTKALAVGLTVAEHAWVVQLLRRHHGNVAQAACTARRSSSWLRRRIRQHKIDLSEFRTPVAPLAAGTATG